MAKVKSPAVEDLDVEGVVQLLEKNEMGEFVAFIRERRIDGKAFLTITEGTVKLWQPKANAMKLIRFIEQMKHNPAKFVESGETKAIKTDIENQYQKVSAKSSREQNSNVTVSGVEEIIKKIVPPKSFLYRDRTTKVIKPIISYVPMDAGTPKKPKRFFRLSSYEYPHFDMKQFRLSNNETNCGDRGYYSIKTNSRYYLQKTFRKVEARTKYKSLSTLETVDKSEDHFYEDLYYNDVGKATYTSREEPNMNNTNVKTYRVKIQELFSSFKLPFFKKTDDVIEGERKVEIETEPDEEEKDGHIYENSDSIASMYSSVREETETSAVDGKHHKLQVEEYLEPVQVHQEYCDVTTRHKDDSILGYIRNLFGSFGIRWETNDADQSEESDDRPPLPDDIRKSPGQIRTNMADRPLPVPVENEPYYMNIDRSEAENLLRGQPDGTFLLRPSGQPNHAYTLTVSCSGAVHNVGVRRRTDGRLALGFARRGERSFPSVTSLLRHHRKQRLLLVAGGSVCGATTLNGSPEYYQTPSSLPLP